jgi:hypothetical protein
MVSGWHDSSSSGGLVPSREKSRPGGDERIGDGKVAALKETKDMVRAGLGERFSDRLVNLHEINTCNLRKRCGPECMAS